MPRFAANLSMLFRAVSLLARFGAARQAGFEAAEVFFPSAEPGNRLQKLIEDNRLHLCLINCPPPNYAGGARGFAALPGGEARFEHDFRRVLRYAGLLRPQHLHIMAGVASGQEAHATFVRNLAWAAAEAPDQSLTIEPINPSDMPGYFLSDFDQASEILDEVNAPNVNLQFDAYHAHRITGDTMSAWDRHGHRAVHVQIARAEGRHEPSADGAIDYDAFLARLDADGYDGWVSAEYIPEGSTEEGLGWFSAARQGRA